MNKDKVIFSILYLLFGIMFIVASLSIYGALCEGAFIFAGFVKPANWIFGLLFGGVLAVRALFCKPAAKANNS